MRSLRGIPSMAASSRAPATVVWFRPIPHGCAMTPCIMSAPTAWRPAPSAAGASAVRACPRVRDPMRENSRPAASVWAVAVPIIPRASRPCPGSCSKLCSSFPVPSGRHDWNRTRGRARCRGRPPRRYRRAAAGAELAITQEHHASTGGGGQQMRQPLPSIGAVLVKLRRDDGYRERLRRFRAKFRHSRKPLADFAGVIDNRCRKTLARNWRRWLNLGIPRLRHQTNSCDVTRYRLARACGKKLTADHPPKTMTADRFGGGGAGASPS